MTSSNAHRFDEVFEREGHGLPVEFLRALAKNESNNNPANATGPAWGLLQVGINKNAGNVLKSYNERHGTSLSKTDMLDPALNVRVATDLLARIVDIYRGLGIVEDWSNANFVGLVVAGWNSGYSKKAGVAKAIAILKKRSVPISLAAVYKLASEDKTITRHLRSEKKQTWQRRVVASYFRELGREPGPESKGQDSWLPILLLLALWMR